MIDEVAVCGNALQAEEIQGIMKGLWTVEPKGKLVTTWVEIKAQPM